MHSLRLRGPVDPISDARGIEGGGGQVQCLRAADQAPHRQQADLRTTRAASGRIQYHSGGCCSNTHQFLQGMYCI